MQTSRRSSQQPASSFSLAALLFMITGVAVLLAISIPAVHTLTQRQVRPRIFLGASLSVGGLTSILGALIGLFHYRRGRGLSWGLLVGAVIGVCVGPLVLSREYGQVVGTCLGGSLLLLILAFLFRAGLSVRCRMSHGFQGNRPRP